MRQAQADRDGRWCFQRDDHAEHAAGEHVDGDGQIRAANRLPVALIDHDHVDDRVVNLYLLQRCCHGRRVAASTLQAAGRILAFPPASDLARIEAGDPQCHGVARRHPQLLRFASLRDLAVERCQSPFLLGQEPLLQQLADDALDRLRQAPLAFATAGLAGDQVRHEAAALPGSPDQNVHLPPRQAQRLSSHIGRFVPDRLRLRQRADDLRTTARTLPSLIRQSGHALLGNPWGVGRHAHLALVHTSIEHSRDWCRSLLILDCQELAAQQPLHSINWCSRLLKMTLLPKMAQRGGGSSFGLVTGLSEAQPP